MTSLIKRYKELQNQRHASSNGKLYFLSKHWSHVLTSLKWNIDHRRSYNTAKVAHFKRTVSRVVYALKRKAHLFLTKKRVHALVARKQLDYLKDAYYMWRSITSAGTLSYSKKVKSHLHWVLRAWKTFKRGIKLIKASCQSCDHSLFDKIVNSSRKIDGNSSGSSSPTKRGKAKWVCFRGRIFRRRQALIRLMKHNIRVIVQQRTAQMWGERW